MNKISAAVLAALTLAMMATPFHAASADVRPSPTTPSGKVSIPVCGSAFGSGVQGTSVKAPFTAPATSDKSFIYTCSASQTKTTSACNPPK